jgi:hypothetical protein
MVVIICAHTAQMIGRWPAPRWNAVPLSACLWRFTRNINVRMPFLPNLLRTSKFCLHAYRAAVWDSRQNSRDVYGWLSRPYADASYRCLESPPKTPLFGASAQTPPKLCSRHDKIVRARGPFSCGDYPSISHVIQHGERQIAEKSGKKFSIGVQ